MLEILSNAAAASASRVLESATEHSMSKGVIFICGVAFPPVIASYSIMVLMLPNGCFSLELYKKLDL